MTVSIPSVSLSSGGRCRLLLALVVTLTVALATGSLATADVFIRKNGGRIEGELLNRDESPRKTYQIRLGDNKTIVLDAEEIREVQIQSPAEKEYELRLRQMPDTVDGHWQMAQWCRDHELDEHEQFHLAELIKHDPDHELARRRLGYVRIDGRWVRPNELRREQGYRPFQGRWRVQQDIDAMQWREQQEKAEIEWRNNIATWLGWLRRGRDAEKARQQLAAVRDPNAAPVLAERLADKDEPEPLKLMYVEILGRLDGAPATTALVHGALADAKEEVRLSCIDQLVKRQDPLAVDMLVQALSRSDVARINRAAVGLARLKDGSAIPYLIDVLTVQQKEQVRSNPGQISAFFPRGGGNTGGIGLSAGASRPRSRVVTVQNRSVLDALIALTDTNLGFDKERWNQWYIDKNTLRDVNLRRSD